MTVFQYHPTNFLPSDNKKGLKEQILKVSWKSINEKLSLSLSLKW